MSAIMKDNHEYANTDVGTQANDMYWQDYLALPESQKMNGDFYCIPDKQPEGNPSRVWAKLGVEPLDTEAENVSGAINELNSSLTIEELGTSNILTPVSGVTMNDRACWKIGKFVYLNAVFTISNPTQSVNDLATYKAGYAPSSAYLCPVMSYATGNDAGASSLLNLRTNKVDVEHTGGKPYLVISVIYKVA